MDRWSFIYLFILDLHMLQKRHFLKCQKPCEKMYPQFQNKMLIKTNIYLSDLIIIFYDIFSWIR